jgi:hypothetical protein
MRPEDSMPKSNFTNPQNWDHTKEWLTADMKIIMEIFGKNNVGIITFSEFGSIVKSFGFDVEYYGNLRGTNVLEDKPVLVLIGSYLPIVASWIDSEGKREGKSYFEEILSKYFLLNVDEKNLVSIGIEAPKLVSSKYDYKLARVYGYKYIGKVGELLKTPADLIVQNPAEALNTLFWYDEIYQAFHRNRGLRKERIIFSYCWFPEPGATIYSTNNQGYVTNTEIGKLQLFTHNIRNEFNIDKIENDIVNEFFNLLKEEEKDGLIEQMVTYIQQHPDATATEIVDKYRNYKKGIIRGPDTKTITWLINCINILKEQAKRPE